MLYNLHFFYWDPLLLVDHIPCPNRDSENGAWCSGWLTRHGYLSCPRSVVDLEDRFWLIGVCYKCNKCTPAVTFQSWEYQVLWQLPHSLSMEFPAYLTHQSGVSNSTFAMMQCCFQNGMGTKQFSDAINVMHWHWYEMLEVQYLRSIHEKSGLAGWLGKTFPPFPAFMDRLKVGVHAVIPSGQWFRDIYDKFIESHEAEFDQHTTQLSACGCAIDHSYKVISF